MGTFSVRYIVVMSGIELALDSPFWIARIGDDDINV